MLQRTIIVFSIAIFFVIWISIVNSPSEIHSTSITGFDKPVGVWGPFSNNDHNLEQ